MRRKLRERAAQHLLVALRELARETGGTVPEHAGEQVEGRRDPMWRLEQHDHLFPPALTFEDSGLLAALARKESEEEDLMGVEACHA